MKSLPIVLMIFCAFLFFMASSSFAGSSAYYRFAEQDGRLALKGRMPIPSELGLKINCYRFVYDESKRLSSVEYYRHGKPAINESSDFFKVSMEYSPNFEKRTFYDIKGNKKINSDGVYAIGIKYDDSHNPVSLFNYDINGNIFIDYNDIAQYAYETDKEGRIVKEIYYDQYGIKTGDKEGRIEQRFEYDSRGNKIGLLDYKKTTYGEADFDGANRYSCDNNGNLVEMRYYGKDGKLEIRTDKGAAVIRNVYDENGYLKYTYCYGIDEIPIISNVTGAYVTEFVYDEYGDMIEEKYFGIDGKLVNSFGWSGAAIIRHKYDEYGNEMEWSILNKDNMPTLSNDEYKLASAKFAYDSQRNMIEGSHYGVNGEPREQHVDGIAKVKFKYDDKGNLIYIKNYGVDGKPKNSKETGVAAIFYRYDGSNNLIRKASFGSDGKPKAQKGYKGASYRYSYSRDGIMIKETPYDAKGKIIK